MYLDSGYAKPISSFRYPVPVPTVDPDAAPVVCVAVNQAWIAYVAGACKQLLLQTTWDTTDPTVLALVQERVFNLISQLGAAVACMEFAVRQDPLDSCFLDFSTDGGTTWTPFANISACVNQMYPPTNPPGQGQPGEQPGGGTPTPGQCFDLDISINGNQQVLIPFPVTDRWEITISNVTGAWADGPTITAEWACYDGHFFLLGQCALPTSPGLSTDPLPSANHCALILRGPSAALAPLTSGTLYTVPTGTGTGNYVLQMNDEPIADNQGAIHCHLHVCSPMTPPLTCITYDLTGSMGPWQFGTMGMPPGPTTPPSGDAPTGSYTSGFGAKVFAGTIDGTALVNLVIYGLFASTTHVTNVTFSYHYVAGGVGYRPTASMGMHHPGDPSTTWTHTSPAGEAPQTIGTVSTYTVTIGADVDGLSIFLTDGGGGWDTTEAYISSITINCT